MICFPSRATASTSLLLILSLGFNNVLVNAQPSPEVQKRISAAIKAAAHATTVDYTAFVNPFIGTGALCYHLSYL